LAVSEDDAVMFRIQSRVGTLKYHVPRSTDPAFIAVVLTTIAIAHRIDGLVRMRGYVMTGTTHAIGGLASFWFIERVAQIV
jgi:hypothetical protein